MKTFIVIVQEPRVRTTSVSKLVVVAEDAEKAIEVVKSYFPKNCRGWATNATFKVETEVASNSAKMI